MPFHADILKLRGILVILVKIAKGNTLCANGEAMFEEIKKSLVYMGLTEEEYRKALKPIAEDNIRSVMAWSTCTAVFWILSLILSLNSSAYAACRMVYICALAASAVTMIGTAAFPKPDGWMRFLLINLMLFSVLFAGIGIAVCQPDVRTASMIAFVLIVPTCVISSTIDNIIRLTINLIAYILAARGVIQPEIYSWGLTNLILFSAAGIVIGHVNNKCRFERYVYAESARELAEIQEKLAYYDQLTGFKNRRAYTEKKAQLEAEKPDHLCVVIADLNGLKQTNDVLGHDVGDSLLKGASECISEAFENIDSIYRIGGDEFCIITNGTKEEAERCAKELDRLTAHWKRPAIDRLSICYGIAEVKDNKDLESVIKEADQAMYESKRNYYKNSGEDRRRR